VKVAPLLGHIRQLIEPDPAHPRYLKTIRGAGYCFAAHDKPQVTDFGASKTIAIRPVTRLTQRIASSSVAGLRSIS